jgi:O-methyltransferase involved in polyketide biosynthesis
VRQLPAMAPDEILSRIDRHMGRGNELMAEIREEMRLSRASHERIWRGHQDQLQFTREVVRRNELAFQENSRILAELYEDVKAHTQAILRVLDRLGGGEAPATS